MACLLCEFLLRYYCMLKTFCFPASNTLFQEFLLGPRKKSYMLMSRSMEKSQRELMATYLYVQVTAD